MAQGGFDNRRVVLCANTDWYLANFRLDLVHAVRDNGAEVHLVAPAGRYLSSLGEQGLITHELDLGNESYSLFDNRRSLSHLKHLYAKIQPDLAHHFTPRCVVLGSMAARKTGVRCIVNALTGLGHVFTSETLKSKLARPVLRWLLRKNLNGERRSVIFQNDNDMRELIDADVVDARRCHLVRGSGVDPERFRAAESARDDDEIRVLFASRLIREKGIDELVTAMHQVVAAQPKAVLWVAGEPYAQNPTTLTGSDLNRLSQFPWLKLFGHVDDVLPLLQQADIVALPSYREGTPKILLEAASCELPIVATDIAGCRGVVEHGKNGYLVPTRNVPKLAEAISALCADAELRREMGRRGREIIKNGFSSEIVIRKTLDVYRGLLGDDRI